MSIKHFMSKLFSRYMLVHLSLMALFVVLLVIGVAVWLDFYTHHGEGIEVPQVKGMTYNKARLLLDEKRLTVVVSDSGYNKQMPANSILAQSPGAGTMVKAGHTVYVTVNSPSSPTFAIPDIVDNASLREAEAKLTAMGFRLLPAQRVTGEKDWVYGILCRGRRVSNGDRIAIDYPLTLMVGSGSYDESDEYEYVDEQYGAVGESETDEFEEVKEAPLPGTE
ncbi:MAG: PASTA domain-containing protein [Prevotella sp.]|nr:PASTA domain-containing protein [Prevotella sp.]